MKIFILIIAIILYPISAHAITYDQILAHKASISKPYWGDYYEYKNVKWLSHTPSFLVDLTEEQMEELTKEALTAVDERGQIDIGSVDFDGDGKDEYIKVIWTAYGGPAKGLIIDIYTDKRLENKIISVNPQSEGYHPNFKIEDIDSDGFLELVTFTGVPDLAMSGAGNDEKPFEARFADRFLRVSIYKYEDSMLKLSQQYLTKEKFGPHYVPVDVGLPK